MTYPRIAGEFGTGLMNWLQCTGKLLTAKALDPTGSAISDGKATALKRQDLCNYLGNLMVPSGVPTMAL